MVIKMMIEIMAMVAMMFVEMDEKEKIEFPIVMMIIEKVAETSRPR